MGQWEEFIICLGGGSYLGCTIETAYEKNDAVKSRRLKDGGKLPDHNFGEENKKEQKEIRSI